ncbi:MAG: DNA/RNA non-specific endonuclease [Nevskiales bacterium]
MARHITPRKFFRWFKTAPLLGTAALAAFLAWSVNEQRLAAPLVWGGLPKANARELTHVLRNPGFTVGYSELRRNPLWVAYRVRAVRKKNRMPRPRGFNQDWRTLWWLRPSGFREYGYDRGHLAPNYAIGQLYGREAQYATFRLSNISPQSPELNRELWQRLEEIEVDDFAPRLGELQVIAGPVFWKPRELLPGGVEIPDAFYKILVDYDAKTPQALAFVMPQRVNGGEPLDRFVVSVGEVERVTGLDFFSRLSDAQESQLERARLDSHWRLTQVARKPGRYRVGD